jgi:6,7-dimethyl-8-ribityllumazine synthase
MSRDLPSSLEGTLAAPDDQFAICAARFNEHIVQRLLLGAREGFARFGVDESRLAVVRVPGAWELPLACAELAKTGRFAAIVALGAVVRGETPHFDYVAGQAAMGLARVALDASVPVIFGVLTTDSVEHAEARAGGKDGNKGFDAAQAAVEMANLTRTLRGEKS